MTGSTPIPNSEYMIQGSSEPLRHPSYAEEQLEHAIRRAEDEGEEVPQLQGDTDMGSAPVGRDKTILHGMRWMPLVQRECDNKKGGGAEMESAAEVHIEALIEDELDRIVKEHGYFSSDHEAYAVIKEEVEEVEEDLDNLQFCLEMFWEHVRNDDDNLENAEAIERNGIELIKEAVQVIACCRKYKRGHLKDWLEKKAKRVGGQHDAD